MLQYVRVIEATANDPIDKDRGGFKTAEGKIIAYDEVPVAEYGYVRVAGDSSKQRLFCEGTEPFLNADQQVFGGRCVVRGNVLVDLAKVLFCEAEESNRTFTRRHGASCEYHERPGLRVSLYRRQHGGLERPRVS